MTEPTPPNANRTADTSQSLVPTGARSAPLTKGQKTFARLIQKVEKLRHDITETREEFRALLALYGAQIRPRELLVRERTMALIRALHPQVRNPKVGSPAVRDDLKEVIFELFDQLESLSNPGQPIDPELDAIHRDLSGESFSEMQKELQREDYEDMKEELQEQFDLAGIKVDLSSLDPNLPPEQLQARVEEIDRLITEATARGDEKTGKKRSSKGQPSKKTKAEQAAELQATSLNRLYRQLARLLHPDLESDPVQRQRKEEAMKRLTIAYKAGDLHALLGLELEWIEQSGGDLANLTEEKLAIYNGILKEQVEELDRELTSIPWHPNFAPLRAYSTPYQPLRRWQCDGIVESLDQSVTALDKTLTDLAGPKAAKVAHGLVMQARRAQPDPRLYREF